MKNLLLGLLVVGSVISCTDVLFGSSEDTSKEVTELSAKEKAEKAEKDAIIARRDMKNSGEIHCENLTSKPIGMYSIISATYLGDMKDGSGLLYKLSGLDGNNESTTSYCEYDPVAKVAKAHY